MFRLFECCALSFFERFVLSFSLKIERFVSDSAEIWICGLYIVSVMNTEVKAQENNFITNEEVKNELVVAKTIFKQDGAQLYRHIRYEYSYDDQKRLTCKEASKWDGAKDEWIPYFKMTYQYGNDEITMSYARWNESHKAYDKDMKKSVYELNDENMPVAYKLYNQDAPKSELTLVSYNKTDYVANILAMAE